MQVLHNNELVIANNDLENKTSDLMSQVFPLAVEYLVAGICEQYSKLNGINSAEEFNEKNKISPWTLSAYPFFIALANGHSLALYTLFGNFYKLSFGPTSFEVFSELTNEDNDHLKYFQINNNDATINLRVLDPNNHRSFGDIQESLKKEQIQIDQDNAFEFSRLRVAKDKPKNGEEPTTPLYLAINNGIQTIISQSNSTFFNSDERTIMFQSNYYFDSVKVSDKTDKLVKLDLQDIKEPMRRAFYSEKMTP